MTPEEIHKFLVSNIVLVLIFTTVGAIVSWIGYIQKFYNLPYKSMKGPEIKFYDVLFTFCIFFAVYFITTPVLCWVFASFFKGKKNLVLYITLLQFCIFLLTALFLFIYARIRNYATMRKVWKDPKLPNCPGLQENVISAWLTLVVAAPVILAASHISEVLRIWIFGYSPVEQLAVRYLKLALSSPFVLISSIITVLILAPILEEYLFRGILQSWLRNQVGPVKAIFITALCFGVFHFSPLQSSTNLPLIVTLTTFSCYLGFLYEKSRTLFAPIFLHVTFNCISVIRIIFTEV